MGDAWDGTERRGNGGELSAVRVALAEVGQSVRDQNEHLAEVRLAIGQQNRELERVQAALPGFAQRSHLYVALATTVLVIVLAVLVGWQFRRQDQASRSQDRAAVARRAEDLRVAATTSARDRDDAIVRGSCALQSVLLLSQSTAARNPVPPGLDDAVRKLVEDSRAAATEI